MFEVGDLVRVRSSDGGRMETGLVIDLDPSEDCATYYTVSVGDRAPEWYHEDEVFDFAQHPVKVKTPV